MVAALGHGETRVEKQFYEQELLLSFLGFVPVDFVVGLCIHNSILLSVGSQASKGFNAHSIIYFHISPHYKGQYSKCSFHI